MVRVVFPGFYAALLQAASYISVDKGQSGNEERGSENVCLHVALCDPGDWSGLEWHTDGLLPQGPYAPRAMTHPPAFTGYAEVRQTVGYAENPVSGLASWERGGSVAQSDVIRERG
ncbi:hypothetical protein P0D73_37075 [Paraburkholderia sp. RL18-101-BIB-B]|uniref:hypothetical protein n=1 Tax=unclassified Paraburkholderia TaxID=2615204 RepID=UPI0038BDB785